MMLLELKNKILRLHEDTFEQIALEVFHYQMVHNSIYAQFVRNLGIDSSNITKLEQIPCLPIEFFKYKELRSVSSLPTIVFESSGTTQVQKSKHLLTDTEFYVQNSVQIFEKFPKSPDDQMSKNDKNPNQIQSPHR